MNEAEKVEEAEYFLKQMASVEGDRKAYKWNLSAFLSAARSVLQFAREETRSQPGGQAWYDSQVAGKPVVSFFKERRDVSIHKKPISPIKELQVHIEETLHLDMAAEAVVIRDGRVVPPESQRHTSRLPEGTNWPIPPRSP